MPAYRFTLTTAVDLSDDALVAIGEAVAAMADPSALHSVRVDPASVLDRRTFGGRTVRDLTDSIGRGTFRDDSPNDEGTN